MALVQVSDVIVPEIFTPYVMQMTEEKSRIVQAGILEPNELLAEFLAGGGLTVNAPSFQDLANDTDNVSGDDPPDIEIASFENSTPTDANRKDAVPKKVQTSQEIAVRLSRNQAWQSSDLAAALAGTDPMGAIANKVAGYWARRLQAAFIATINGVIKDNVANDSADYQNDISNSGTFIDGVTNFSAEAVLDAALTMGDSQEDLTAIVMHSVVYNRAQKNNLIDFIPDSDGRVNIPTFLGRRVIVDDGVPRSSNVYDTWLFGAGFCQFAQGAPKVPTEVERSARAGNGGGTETLHSRLEWCIHPSGHAYSGTAPIGGPSNAASSNNLNIATSWDRVFPERKQIKFARLITTEA